MVIGIFKNGELHFSADQALIIMCRNSLLNDKWIKKKKNPKSLQCTIVRLCSFFSLSIVCIENFLSVNFSLIQLKFNLNQFFFLVLYMQRNLGHSAEFRRITATGKWSLEKCVCVSISSDSWFWCSEKCCAQIIWHSFFCRMRSSKSELKYGITVKRRIFFFSIGKELKSKLCVSFFVIISKSNIHFTVASKAIETSATHFIHCALKSRC